MMEKLLQVEPEVKSGLLPIDAANLWIAETITDMTHADMTVMIPISVSRTRDTTRKPRYFSSVNANMGFGPVQVRFEIAATSLEDALSKFVETAEAAVQKQAQEIQSQRTRAALSGANVSQGLPFPGGARKMNG